MTRTILLHVGAPKCGSTFLQRVLHANSARLSRAGILYPDPPGEHPGNAERIAEWDAARLEALFARHRTLILSHEDLFGRPARQRPFAAVVRQAGAKLRLIAFLRPLSEIVFGGYSQHLKQYAHTYIARGEAYDGQSFEEFAAARARPLQPATHLTLWRETFPEADMVLERHARIRPVIERLTGLCDLDWRVDHHATNPSFRVADCEDIALCINSGRIGKEHLAQMLGLAAHKAVLPDPGRTPERRRWIEALLAPETRRLAEEFGLDLRAAAMEAAAAAQPACGLNVVPSRAAEGL